MDGTVECNHNGDQSIGRKDKSCKKSERKEATTGLCNDILNGPLNSQIRIVWQDALNQLQQLLLEICYWNIGNQRKKKNNRWENGKDKVKGNG